MLVCGAGSIGVYVGTKLHLRNHDVLLVGRRKLRQVKETIIIDGKKYEVPEKLFEIPKNHEADIVFVTTKLYDFEPMINAIKNKANNLCLILLNPKIIKIAIIRIAIIIITLNAIIDKISSDIKTFLIK